MVRVPVIRALLVLLSMWGCLSAEDHLVSDVAAFDRTVSRVQPGDTIVLADGEWRDADLRFLGHGHSDKPIVLRAQTPGKVVLSGASRLRIAGEYLIVRHLLWQDSFADDDVIAFRIDSKRMASRCVVEHCALLGDDSKEDRKWVSIYGNDNTVERCWFEGKTSRGALLVVWLLDGAVRHQIRGNFFGTRKRLGKNGGETIRVGDSETSLVDANCEVSQNFFYRCDGEAEIISNKSCGNRYVSNAFVGCSGALTLRHGNDCVVERNVFLGDGQKGTGGVRVIGERHRVVRNAFIKLLGEDTRAAISIMNGIVDSPANGYVQVRDVSIEENLFIKCKESIVVGNFDRDQKTQTMAPTGCRLKGNRVVSHYPVFRVVTPPITMLSTDNIYFAAELGNSNSAGWKKSAVDDLWDGHVSAVREAVTDLIGSAILQPQSTGPEWKVPGEDYLPRFEGDSSLP